MDGPLGCIILKQDCTTLKGIKGSIKKFLHHAYHVSKCQSSINLANTKFLAKSTLILAKKLFKRSFLFRIGCLPNLPFQNVESQGREDKRSNFPFFFWQNSILTVTLNAKGQWMPKHFNEDLKPMFLLEVLFSKW